MKIEDAVDKVAETHTRTDFAAQIAASMVSGEFETVDARMPIVVGITGYARHGKNTAGEVFERQGFRQFAFADALKSMAVVLNPIIYVVEGGGGMEHPEKRLSDVVKDFGWEYAKSNPEVRRFLQVLGTEAVREHLGQDAWVHALELEIAKSAARRVVITDVRFPNEAEWVHSRGGHLIRVVRLNDDGTAYDSGVDRTHGSEKYVESLPADAVVEAKDSATLQREIASLVGQITFGGAP